MITRADVGSYVAAVRAELADLDADVVEELTGGLEADLSELAAEADTPLADRIGSPVAYAAELRSAAGLEPSSRLATARARSSRTWSRVRSEAGSATRSIRELRSWAPLREFLIVLAPAWWVLRAWVAYELLARPLLGDPYSAVPSGAERWLLLIAMIVLSVQLGRERERPRWLTRAVVLGNVAALIALPIAADGVADGPYAEYPEYEYASVDGFPGLAVDGVPVSNIYAYDADGEPIYGVQLFTQDGTPLEISESARGDEFRNGVRSLLPAIDDDGDRLWNVFPLGIGGRFDGDDRGRAPRLPDWAGPLAWFAQAPEPDPVVTTPPPSEPPTSPPTTTPPTEATTPAPTEPPG